MRNFFLSFALLILPSTMQANSIFSFTDDFESGFRGWRVGIEMPQDPSNKPFPREAFVELTDENKESGSYALKIFQDGRSDDGTAWLERYFYLTPNTDYSVDLSFDLWTTSPLFAYIPIYVGGKSASTESDFKMAPMTKNKWSHYRHVLKGRTDAKGRLFVALGTSMIWETTATFYIDNVSISIE